MPDNAIKSHEQCPACGLDTQAGLRFCTRCGAQAAANPSATTDWHPNQCSQCGFADDLNRFFCVACGDKLAASESLSTNRTSRKTGFYWRTAKVNPVSALAKSGFNSIQMGLDRRTLAASVLLGLLCGTLLGWKLVVDGTLPYIRERIHWPRQGLVVYTEPAGAQITLEEENSNLIALAQTGSDGALRLGQLPVGKYRMFIELPGYKSVFAELQTKEDRPTVLGYPSALHLSTDKGP